MFESVLVDTSAAILLFNGSKSATQAFNEANAVYVPSLVYGELFLGMEGASDRELEEKKIKEFQQKSQLLSIDYATTKHYAKIAMALRLKGKPIPTNDMWIAAIAIQHQLPLLAKDKHFDWIDGLKVLEI